ncbi:DHHA1 domain-containing protein, partial [Bacillus cereus]|nr:DHHA1 domain-containing protein [Bacillus cereus]
LQKENESLAAKLSNIEAGNLTDSVMTVDGVNVLAAKVNVADMNNLRTMMDDLKNKLESAVVVLASVNDDKVNILAGVTKDLISQGYHAGKLVKEVASRCG